jgi:hypothetical protein
MRKFGAFLQDVGVSYLRFTTATWNATQTVLVRELGLQ